MKTMLGRSLWRSIIRLQSGAPGLHSPTLYKPFHTALLLRQLDGDIRSEVPESPPGPLKRDLCHHCWSWLPAGQIEAHIAAHHSGMQSQKMADPALTGRELQSRAPGLEEGTNVKSSKAMCQHCGRFVSLNQMDQHVKECRSSELLERPSVDSRSANPRGRPKSRKPVSSGLEVTGSGSSAQLQPTTDKAAALPLSSLPPVSPEGEAPIEDEQNIFELASSLVMCDKCEKFMTLAELDFHVQEVHQHPEGDTLLPRKRPWESEDIARLDQMFQEGFSDQQIGRLLQRSPSSITLMRRRKFGSRGYQWTKEEKDRMDEMIKNGQSDAEIGKVMGRPPSWIAKLRKSTKRIDRWTDQDVEQLNQLLEQGLSDGEIAERLGRTKHSINAKRQKLGIIRLSEDGKWFSGIFRRFNNMPAAQDSAPGQKHRSWTPDEVKKLQELVAEGMTDQRIADILGRTRSSVSGFRRRKLEPPGNKNLDRLFHSRKPALWSPEEIEILRSLTEQGLGDLEIARKLGRNRMGVASAKRNHLIRTEEGVRVKEQIRFKPRYWSQADLSTLKELVLQGMADPDIAARLNRPDQAVTIQRRKLGLRKRTPIWHLHRADDAARASHMLATPRTERDTFEDESIGVNASSETTASSEELPNIQSTTAETGHQERDLPAVGALEGGDADCESSTTHTPLDDADAQRPWTESEVSQLEQLCNSDLTSQDIASELGRSLTDVLAAREKYGFEVKEGTSKPRSRWSSAQLEELRSLLATGMPEPDIASRFGVTLEALQQIRRRKGLTFVEGETRKTRTWTAQEIEQVKTLKHEGKSLKEIANAVSRSQRGVQTILARIKAETEKPQSPRSYRTWTDDDIKTLRRLYVEEKLSLGAIAEKIGRTKASLKTFLAKHRENLKREDFAELLKRTTQREVWTEDEIARMTALLGEGRSVSEVAREMGKGRVSVQWRKFVEGRKLDEVGKGEG